MPDPSCGQVRTFLAAAAEGRGASDGADVWNSLVTHRAIEGSPEAPQLTAVGRHLLTELTVRASRIDGTPLETAAADLERVIRETDRAAKTAEYFLAELGPVTPQEIVSYLRPVSVELANRRETADQLAEEFRNVWGSVEVTGGGARDRLLAAELLEMADAPLETMLAPFMQLAQRIRETTGGRGPSVAPAALLQLLADADKGPVPFDVYQRLGQLGLTAEEAALLAGITTDPAATAAQRGELIGALAGQGLAKERVGHAATVLIALGATSPTTLQRVRRLGGLLGARLPDPMTAGAALASVDYLEPEELANWVDKAAGMARQRQLAPTDPELYALAVGLVIGLRRTDFFASEAETGPVPIRHRCALVLALDAWLYRLMIEPSAVPTIAHR